MSLVPTQNAPAPPQQPTEVGYPLSQTGGQQTGQPPASIDIWGALARRKFIVFLACIVAAGLGYLDYERQPQRFASSTRLMITTQTPPRLVNGDLALQREAMPRHTNLLTSQLVLGAAIKNGELKKLDTFTGVQYPISMLSGMVSVNSLSRNDDTLMIRCEGSDPEDLPIILNQIVEAYKGIISEDSETVGKDTIELIQKLGDQMASDKDTLEARYLGIIKRHGLAAAATSDQVKNPFLQRMQDLVERKGSLDDQLRQAIYRAKTLSQAINSDDDTQRKMAAIDAKSYLGLARTSTPSSTDNIKKDVIARDQSNRLGLIAAAENRIAELKFERAKLSRVFGKGHNTITNIDDQISYWQGYIKRNRDQLVIESQEAEARATVADGNAKEPTVEELRAQEDAEWVLLYKMALDREVNRVTFEIQAIDLELEMVEKNATAISQDVAELNLLKKQIEEKREANRAIIDRISEINILADNYTRTRVRVLDPPGNGYKISPVLSKSLGYAVFLGALVGLALALLIDRSDMSFRSPFEIFERLKIPVVGKIPRIRTTRKEKPAKGVPQLVVANRPGSSVSEAFRDIRTALFFRANTDDVKTILFTSPSPGDGKSTTVSNLAVSIAQTGKSVVLVDADFRRPRVDTYFGEPLEPGLINVLEGKQSLSEALCESELQKGLFLLTAGGRPANPGEIVTSPAFKNIVMTLRESFDFVLIDSPPVLPVADPGTIAGIVDGVYLVVRIRKGVKLTAQKAKENLDRVNPNWMGIIVNGIDENPHYNEYYNYPYYATYHGRYYDSQNRHYRESYRDNIEKKS